MPPPQRLHPSFALSNSRPLMLHRSFVSFSALPVFVGTESDFAIHYPGHGCFKVPSEWATAICCSMPLIALILCVIIALCTDFERATRTHCEVPNILPSISVAIGDFFWGRILWKTLIFAHLPPRVLAAFAYAQIFRTPFESRGLTFLRYFTCILNLTELFFLGLLSAFNSKDNHSMHVFAFSVFQISSMLHAGFHIRLYLLSGRSESNRQCRKSFQLKKRYFFESSILLACCTAAYIRHNVFCEPYMFSLFATFEYSLVVTNILFHSTFRLDFSNTFLYLL